MYVYTYMYIYIYIYIYTHTLEGPGRPEIQPPSADVNEDGEY